MKQNLEHSFKAPLAGVLARYNGAMTGELKIRFTSKKKGFIVEVSYQGVDTWYPIVGGNLKVDEVTDEIAQKIVNHLKTDLGDLDHDGNHEPSNLKGFKL